MAGSRGRGLTMIKDINRKLVYSTVKELRHSTRTELARRLGLNKNTVNGIVDELIAAGYIRETGELSRNGAGRRAIGIEFHAANRKAIGMQLMPSSLRCVVTDLYASPLGTFEIPLENTEPETVADIAAAFAADLADLEGKDTLVGLGMGIPALFDAGRDTVLGSSHLGWRNVPFRQLMQDRCKLKVELDNHAKMASLGELRHGRGSGAGNAGNFVYCFFGAGVGSSLVVGGEIVRGETGAAGELGHIVVEPDGLLCSCGNRGCLETVAGLPSIFHRLAEAKAMPADRMNGHWLAEQAKRGDEAVLQEMKRVGKAIGLALSSAVNLLNPKAVILDGPLMLAADALIPVIEAELAAKTVSYAGNRAELALSALYPLTGAIGAAAAVIGAWERQAGPLEAMTF